MRFGNSYVNHYLGKIDLSSNNERLHDMKLNYSDIDRSYYLIKTWDINLTSFYIQIINDTGIIGGWRENRFILREIK